MRFLKTHGFVGVIALAAWPNAAFDMCGICCGRSSLLIVPAHQLVDFALSARARVCACVHACACSPFLKMLALKPTPTLQVTS